MPLFKTLTVILVGTLFTGLLGKDAIAAGHSRVSDPPAQTDYFYVVPVQELGISAEGLQTDIQKKGIPHATLEKNPQAWVCRGTPEEKWVLAIRSKNRLDSIRGKIYLPYSSKPRLVESRVDHPLEGPSEPIRFYQALESYYRVLAVQDVAGRSWFQYRLSEAIRLQNKKIALPRGRGPAPLSSIFATFAGTRAIADNLQLDRELRVDRRSKAIVDVNSIEGITIREFDWDGRLRDDPATLDPLARFIPHDQHAIFVESVFSFPQALQEITRLLSPAFGSLALPATDQQIIPGYLDQLKIDFRDLSRQSFVNRIQRVALTGSDPYSEMGTDLGVLLSFDKPQTAKSFEKYYRDRIGANRPIDGIPQSAFAVSTDRTLSAYCFRQGTLVVLANSPSQVHALHRCLQGKTVPLSSLKEFHFFRQRYELTKDETAFVFMSDPAIRRWCSPKWRITQSRRIRALALLQRLQAEHMTTCLAMKPGESQTLEKESGTYRALGKISLSRKGVHSSVYGSIRFVTPVSELDVKQVTREEQQAYNAWRDGYQRNWSNAFDPIAIQLRMSEKRLQVDLSVMPLILSNSYQPILGDHHFGPFAGDSHGNSILHVIAAPGRFIQLLFPGLVLSEFYLDEDTEFWRDFDDEEQAMSYLEKNLQQLPGGLALTFDKPESMEKMIQRMEDGLDFVSKTERTFRGKAYQDWKIPPAPFRNYPTRIYHYKKDKHVLLSFNEKIIQQAITRQDQERASQPDQMPAKRKWLGQTLALQLNSGFFSRIDYLMLSRSYRAYVRERSWSNLPILQEWKREFPDTDPLEIQRSYWGQKLNCAGGGEYRWNSDHHSFYSTAQGSPVQPRYPMGIPVPWREIRSLDAGLRLEADGLRARFDLIRK